MGLSDFEMQILTEMYREQQAQGETLIRIEGRIDVIERAHAERRQREKAIVAGIASTIAAAVSGLAGVFR